METASADAPLLVTTEHRTDSGCTWPIEGRQRCERSSVVMSPSIGARWCARLPCGV